MDILIFVQVLLQGLLLGGIYALIAGGLTMIFGVSTFLNLAHGEFLTISMFVTYVLAEKLGVHLAVAVPAAFLLLMLLGAVLYQSVLYRVQRRSMDTHILFTFGLALVLSNVVSILFGSKVLILQDPFVNAKLSLGQVYVSLPQLTAFVVAILISGALYLLLEYTSFGRLARAVAQDREGAILTGLDVRKADLITFVLGTGAAGLAGALLVPVYYVSADGGFAFTLMSLVVVILGGLGSFPGALAGGILVGLVQSFSSILLPSSIAPAIVFALMIVVLLLKPQGLLGDK